MTTTSYDLTAYPGKAYSFCDPDRLAVIGHLHGLLVSAPDAAVVVELGTGDGSNLIGLAARYPTARFIGVDLAATALATAAARSTALGLTNLTWLEADVAALPPIPADYLIAHGLLSWVPPDTRRAVWRFIGASLNPHGLALISWQVLPGDHTFAQLYGFMRHHTANLADPADRVRQAREAAEWLIARKLEHASPEAAAGLMAQLDAIRALPDAVLRHDVLADHRHPQSLRSVLAEAEAAGITWLANARRSEPGPRLLPTDDARAFVRSLADPIARQSALDALLLTRFRTSVFCRRDEPDLPTSSEVTLNNFHELYAASRVSAERLVALGDTPEVIIATEVGDLPVSGPALAVLHALAADAPAPHAVSELITAGASALGGPDAVLQAVAELWLGDVIELSRCPPLVLGTLPAYPVVEPWVHRLLSEGATELPSRWHRPWPLSDVERATASRLDGHTPAASLDPEALRLLLRKGFLSA